MYLWRMSGNDYTVSAHMLLWVGSIVFIRAPVSTSGDPKGWACLLRMSTQSRRVVGRTMEPFPHLDCSHLCLPVMCVTHPHCTWPCVCRGVRASECGGLTEGGISSLQPWGSYHLYWSKTSGGSSTHGL